MAQFFFVLQMVILICSPRGACGEAWHQGLPEAALGRGVSRGLVETSSIQVHAALWHWDRGSLGRHDSKNAPWRLLLPMWCQVYAYGLYFLSTGACLQVAKWTLALKSEEVWDDRADPQFTSPVLHNYRFHLQLGVRKQKSAQVHEKPRNSGLLHMRTSLCLSCCRLGPCLAHWPKKNVWIHWGFL